MELIPYITINRKRIKEKVDWDSFGSSKLWIVDLDAKRGKEMNFKVYNKLDYLDLILDISANHLDDVFDALTSGAIRVTVSGDIDNRKISSIIEATENAIFIVNSLEQYQRIRELGGSKFFSNNVFPPFYDEFYSENIQCDNCFKLVAIDDYNGRGNKETH